MISHELHGFIYSSKTEAFSFLKVFFAYVNNQFSAHVKRVRSDNGTEFINNEVTNYFSTNGIVHETSCPYIPQQNGVFERKHRHILEVAWSLMLQAHIPIKFWGESIRAATYVINRTPYRVLDYKTL